MKDRKVMASVFSHHISKCKTLGSFIVSHYFADEKKISSSWTFLCSLSLWQHYIRPLKAVYHQVAARLHLHSMLIWMNLTLRNKRESTDHFAQTSGFANIPNWTLLRHIVMKPQLICFNAHSHTLCSTMLSTVSNGLAVYINKPV